MEAEYVEVKRGGKKLILGDFLYKKNKTQKGVVYFVCDNKDCSLPRIQVEDEKVRKASKTEAEFHSHSPCAEEIHKLKTIQAIKDRAANERLVPVSTIYREVTSQAAIGHSPIPERPAFREIKTQIYGARKKNLPPIPKNVDQIELERTWAQTLQGEDFLQGNVGEGGNKILIFTTKKNLQILQASKTVFMDGTFSALPMDFTQLYSIHGNYMGQILPLVYCLLQDKKKETYKRMFNEIAAIAARHNCHFYPKTILTDFEASMFGAISETFPQTETKGCLFHYSQCIWRKVQELGLVVRYREDPVTKQWIQRITALPLVPEDRVDEAFLFLQEHAPDIDQATAMHDYIVDTWVDDDAMFCRNIWNHFVNDGARTDNHVEGWHSKVAGILHGRRTQNIFEYVNLLQRLQQDAEMAAIDLERGELPPESNAVYKNIERKLKSLKNRFTVLEVMDLPQYLDAVKHILKSKN